MKFIKHDQNVSDVNFDSVFDRLTPDKTPTTESVSRALAEDNRERLKDLMRKGDRS